MLRVALLDDHPAVLAGLRRLIDSEPDMKVGAVASSAAGLARELEGVRPDVLILDYDLAREDGLAHCRRIKSRPNPPGVIIYSAYAGPALTLAARVAQADAVVDKAAPVPTLLAAVRRVGSGHEALGSVPRDAFESAVARLEDEDLPVFAMLLDRGGVAHRPGRGRPPSAADRRPSPPAARRARPCARRDGLTRSTTSARWDLDAVLVADLAQDPGGHTRCDDAFRQVLRNDRARTDHGVMPDADARADDDAAAEPHVVGDGDRLAVFPSGAARLGVDRMRRRQQLDPRGDLAASTLTNVLSPMLISPYSQ